MPLTLAYSPCPNDTFIFTPWVEGRIADAPPVVERLEDIDVLNRIALAGEADVVKVSFHAYGHLRDRYCLLRSGGALGRGCGPLVVARSPMNRDSIATATVAIPGTLTTAALLLRLWAPDLPPGQIAGRAEDHERARVGAAAQPQTLEEGILRGAHRGSDPALASLTAFTAWPPNWFRSAAATFAEKLISCREAKRA